MLDPKGFVGTANLTCTWNGQPPQGASCEVAPAAVTLNGEDPASFTVNIATTARSTAAPRAPETPPSTSPWARHAVPLLVGLLMIVVVAAVSHRRPRPAGTPPGNYTLTVAATAGKVTKTTVLGLKVD